MASLRDIRKRVRSVKSSQKITKAMKLVAASKLKRAQAAITQARPYADELAAVLSRVALQGTGEGNDTEALHPMLALRPPSRVLLVVITSDRGLCGAFNSSLLRRAERFISENNERFAYIEVATVGRKARDYFSKRKLAPTYDYPGAISPLNYSGAKRIADDIQSRYRVQQLDAVFLLYNEFVSAITQRVRIHDVLPVTPQVRPPAADVLPPDYVYEPSRADILARLVPRYVTTLIWRSLLESAASEHGARMTAMDSATRNARELTEKLTLQYNRARQATITRELMDIVGGAEALSG